MKKAILLLLVLITTVSSHIYAQPDLPNVSQISKNGFNVLSWVNPYNSNTQDVFVERSKDIDTNYVIIGKVDNIETPSHYFIDTKPQVGDNYYRVIVKFKAGQEWRSNEVLIHNTPESLLNNSNISKDSLQHLVNNLGVVKDPEVTQPTYAISPYVYINPFNGNVNIELEDALDEWYRVKFYDAQNRELFEIPRVNDLFVILDKRNFQQYGMYKFKITKNDENFAEGYISIY